AGRRLDALATKVGEICGLRHRSQGFQTNANGAATACIAPSFLEIRQVRRRRKWGAHEVLITDSWNVVLVLVGTVVAVAGLYWRIRIERIRAEEKAEEQRHAQIASIEASMKQETDQLRGQLNATDERLRELEFGVQRAVGRLEGAVEGLCRSK
ncbi:MAG: hypothetical protein OXU72_09445, partial [Gammaproteobacteria bacterium]|nr:hypothetical protein [Gammaproteobacteria bacterium]